MLQRYWGNSMLNTPTPTEALRNQDVKRDSLSLSEQPPEPGPQAATLCLYFLSACSMTCRCTICDGTGQQ